MPSTVTERADLSVPTWAGDNVKVDVVGADPAATVGVGGLVASLDKLAGSTDSSSVSPAASLDVVSVT
jgi:hypothetical protein